MSQRNGSGELRQESLRLFQIGGIETLGEPAADGREQISCRGPPDLFAPEPREGRRGAQIIGLCLMSSCDAQRFFEGALALLDAVETEEGVGDERAAVARSGQVISLREAGAPCRRPAFTTVAKTDRSPE